MTHDNAAEGESGSRKSRGRFEELPHADPIAFLGTDRHPLSVPPTTHDVEVSIHDDVLPRSHWMRRVLATALGAALVFPIAASFSSDESTALRFTPKAQTEALPLEPGQPAALAVPHDLPPGGLSEGTDPARAMSEERSVADWTDATQPRDGAGVVTEPATPPPQSAKEDVARAVSAAPPVAPRRGGLRSGPQTPLDFAAAMNAVAATNIGPRQCGPDAVGTAAVALTFAPSGHAIRAVIENGSLRGTAAGSCVARELRNVQIAPFDGGVVTVRTSVLLR